MELQIIGQYDRIVPEISLGTQMLVERKVECDSRYRSIIRQLEEMIDLIRQQPGHNLTMKLGQLIDTMTDHIDSENSFMALFDFPLAIKHRLHHQFIRANTAELLHRFRKGHCVLADDLKHIRLLWMNHIHVHDRAFEEFLAS